MDKTRQVALTTRLTIATALCFAISCGGTTKTTQRTQSEPSTSAIKRAKPDSNPVDERGKKWGGWRWGGKRDNCFFVFNNHCYKDKARACKAAKCGSRTCDHKGGGPAEIYCKK